MGKLQQRGYRPSGRELGWFLAWCLIVGLVVYVAVTYFGPAKPLGPDFGASASPALSIREDWIPVPLDLRPSATESSPSGQASVQPKASAAAPASHVSNLDSIAKRGWRPDREGEGDARQLHPEAVRWLKERLDGVAAGEAPIAEQQLATIARLTAKVGRIPYAAQSHGWGLPEDTLAAGRGDCQDKSLLLAEWLIAAGIQEVAVCIGVAPGYRPGEAGHAWVQAMADGKLWRLESTNGEVSRAGSGSVLDSYEAIAAIWRTNPSER